MPFQPSPAALAQLCRFNEQVLAHQPRLDLSGAALRLLARMEVAVQPSSPHALGLEAHTLHVPCEGHAALEFRTITPDVTPRALVLDLHGGGWPLLETAHDDALTAPMVVAQQLATASLACHHASHGELEQVIQEGARALAWALEEGAARFGVERVFLQGDSAGAHLALCAAQRCVNHERFHRLAGIVLFYGVYDLGGSPSAQGATRETLTLDGPALLPLFARLTGEPDAGKRRSRRYSPLYAPLSGLPPTLLVVGTRDPFLDDSLMCHERLRESGVEAELVVIPQAAHGFHRLPLEIADQINAFAREWMVSRR